MNKLRVAVFVISLLSPSLSRAQSVLDLPRPSQKAQVMQRLGLTDVTINYSRPLVNKRKVFGGIVPYGEVWRAGANENTTIQFSDPVSIDGHALQAGTYGLHMIPSEKEWTVIFSRNASSWGSFTYDQKEDALRVAVQPQTSDMHEALTYDFDSVTPDGATLTLRWERVAVPFKVSVDQKQIVPAKLKTQIRGWQRYTWEGWDEAAQALLGLKVDLPDALTYAEESIKAEKRFETLMMKADVLEAMDRRPEAAPLRTEAMATANAIQLNSYGRQLQRAGKQDEAFAVFEMNAKRYPGHFVVHYEQARMLVAKGDYDSAVKEMQTALTASDQNFKPFLEGLMRRLQAKEDINKN